LRDDRRHLRLGFADGAVLGWLADAGLEAAVAARLPGVAATDLGVTLWIGRKPG
jgi:ArsR family transcriptional regulator